MRQIEIISAEHGLLVDKIRNWFKYQRKRQVRNGSMKFIVIFLIYTRKKKILLKKKHSFSKAQNEILLKAFCKKPYLNSEEYKKL